MATQLPSLLSRQSSSSSNEYNMAVKDIANIHKYISQLSGLIANTEPVKDINPLANGVDGGEILLDKDAESGSLLWNQSRSRPKTILEQIQDIAAYTHLTLDESNVSDHLDAIRSRIGSAMFVNPSKLINQADSLDSRVKEIRKDLEQIAADIYSSNPAINQPLSSSDYTYNGNGLQSTNRPLAREAKRFEIRCSIQNGANWYADPFDENGNYRTHVYFYIAPGRSFLKPNVIDCSLVKHPYLPATESPGPGVGLDAVTHSPYDETFERPFVVDRPMMIEDFYATTVTYVPGGNGFDLMINGQRFAERFNTNNYEIWSKVFTTVMPNGYHEILPHKGVYHISPSNFPILVNAGDRLVFEGIAWTGTSCDILEIVMTGYYL